MPADPGGAILEAGAEIRCWNPKRPDRPWVTYRPSQVFPYHDSAGNPIGYVLRIDLPPRGERGQEGKTTRKITPTIRYARLPVSAEDGRPVTGWCHWSFDKPRPLYRLPDLAARPQALA